MFRTALFAAALAGLASLPAAASAQWGNFGGFGGFGGCGFGGFNGCGNGGFGGCGFGGFNSGFGNCGFGGFPGGFFGGSWLAGTTYLRPQFPPYYAVNPPVYYSSMLTKRHYGASPYAWWPGMSPITYLPPQVPIILRNPNAQSGKADLKSVASSEPKPLLIENPFVRPDERSKSVAVAQPIDNPFFVSAER